MNLYLIWSSGVYFVYLVNGGAFLPIVGTNGSAAIPLQKSTRLNMEEEKDNRVGKTHTNLHNQHRTEYTVYLKLTRITKVNPNPD
jgi:hypothetical protein